MCRVTTGVQTLSRSEQLCCSWMVPCKCSPAKLKLVFQMGFFSFDAYQSFTYLLKKLFANRFLSGYFCRRWTWPTSWTLYYFQIMVWQRSNGWRRSLSLTNILICPTLSKQWTEDQWSVCGPKMTNTKRWDCNQCFLLKDDIICHLKINSFGASFDKLGLLSHFWS